MVWHLPHIRAIAARMGEPVTLIAKPRSAADEIFAAEATVRDVLWMDRNPEGRRGRHDGAAGLLRLIGALRARRFGRVILLHHGRTVALACMAAGIPERLGYGSGLQRVFLNRPPFLPATALRLHPFEQASAWITAAGMTMEAEPRLPISEAARGLVRSRLGGRIPVIIGIGSSEPYKQWGAERFAALAKSLAASGYRALALAGGPAERELAKTISDCLGGRAEIIPALGWPLGEVAALCAEAAFYVGNDTGVMNLAAAVGTRTYGLFGAVPAVRHASRIVPILPPDGLPRKRDGMARIAPGAVIGVLEQAERFAKPRPCPARAGSPRP
jgi:heptosyltransferase-2